MSAIENARRQLSIHQKSLRQLEEQKAELGLYAPPYIITGIEQTKAAIAELESTIAELERSGEPTVTPVAKRAAKQRARIQLQGDFSNVSADTAKAAINAFAAIMGISPNEVDLLGITAGSIILDLAVPAHGMEALRARLRDNSAQLRLMNIEQISLTLATGAIEAWVFADGAFRLAQPPAPVPQSPSCLRRVWHFVRNLIIIGVVGTGIVWAIIYFSQPDTPPPKKVEPTPPPPATEEISLELWLPDGCDNEYEAGTDTTIGMFSNATDIVSLQLDGQEFDVQKVAANTEMAFGWQFPQREGAFLLSAIMDNGATAECQFYTYTTAAPTFRMQILPDTVFPNADPYDTFNADSQQQCEEICLDDSVCQAFTYAKVTLSRQVVATCGFYDYVPKTQGNDCCTSGIKVTE